MYCVSCFQSLARGFVVASCIVGEYTQLETLYGVTLSDNRSQSGKPGVGITGNAHGEIRLYVPGKVLSIVRLSIVLFKNGKGEWRLKRA